MTADLIFYALALLTLLPAFWVVLSPNIVHAGFALLFTLFGAAGLYAWMGADFIAITQLMVYVGGVLVLILFTVMMTRVPQSGRKLHGFDGLVPPAVIGLAILAVLWKVITGTQWASQGLGEVQPTTAEIGVNFMTNYIFPFEFVSLVLLAAMIGAAILIRERKQGDDESANEDTEVSS
nr:NADH-quinone oxidoreductase subunit J [Candidatus Krumholzibacteria bacterium]